MTATMPAPPVAKSQKTTTKAERREMQEKQRAAKAQGQVQSKQQPKQGKGASGASSNSKANAGSTPSTANFRDSYPPANAAAGTATVDDSSNKSRGLRIFSHFGIPKPLSHVVKGDIHPAILRLGLQFSEFKITGANARCIATLTAFKTVIQDYVTPQNNTLSRHLMTHLSPQITHLVAARPMSVTMGNAIRQLKLEISNSNIDLPEQNAKDALCKTIDNYLRERIIFADEVIAEIAGKKIHDGDVILTYARSSVVEKILLSAYEQGKQFTVVVADSRPMLEGKSLLQTLTRASIPCTYLLLPALPSIITEITTVFLGAHSLHSNGAVFSRAGTALVAMMAKAHSVPVVVCCETYKFSESVQLDGFTKNELAPHIPQLQNFPRNLPQSSLALVPRANLEILNPLYDLTPPTCITAVVTEVGIIPPSSISSIPLALGKQNL